MNTEQIALVRASFAQLAPDAEAVGLSFYDHLFTLNPGSRRLFREEIAVQSRKLMTMLGIIVAALDQPAKLEAMVRGLGERHVRYGVADAHYDDVGAALIQTLHERLGEAFDEAMESAWATAYAFLAERMIAVSRTACLVRVA